MSSLCRILHIYTTSNCCVQSNSPLAMIAFVAPLLSLRHEDVTAECRLDAFPGVQRSRPEEAPGAAGRRHVRTVPMRYNKNRLRSKTEDEI